MAKLNRKSKHFRLSFETFAYLEAISEKHGITETEVVERGIRELIEREFTLEERNEMVMKKLKEFIGQETE